MLEFFVFPNNCNRIGNTVDRRNRVFNLSEFNAKSSYFSKICGRIKRLEAELLNT